MNLVTVSITDFIDRWQKSGAAERANYQLFLAELCDVLGVDRPLPSQSDNSQNTYVFERTVTFQNGDGSTSTGFIDLYKQGCFVLEAKQGIAIGDKAPEVYFRDLVEQCSGGKKKYGGITDIDDLRANLRMSCIPVSMIDGQIPEYDDFHEQRRKLMAQKMKIWFENL